MSPDQPLTAEQKETLKELRGEIRDLKLEADEKWARYLKDNDEDCFDEVRALDGEVEMLGLIAHIPTVGERKVGKVRKLLARVQGKGDAMFDGCNLGTSEARIKSLESINAWRDSYGLPPLDRLPRGVPGDTQQCTLARAFHSSMMEMGLDEHTIHWSVGGGGSVELRWKDPETGLDKWESPDIAYGSALVSSFDDSNFLDLLEDESLLVRASVKWDEFHYYQNGELLEQMKPLDAELRRRGLQILGTAKVYMPDELILGRDSNLEEVVASLQPAGYDE